VVVNLKNISTKTNTTTTATTTTTTALWPFVQDYPGELFCDEREKMLQSSKADARRISKKDSTHQESPGIS